ncbi:MAG: GNAT family N-acetyltransferase [Lachnospiraceae bacterium]|nr:GNAT family N-acetyltransferase [Lachnospiraceae bacterium]
MDENICGEVRLVDNILQADDFVRLRIEAGFAKIPVEHARKALQNGLINVSAIYHGELVGMGRLVGDGAMYWYLQEIIILPEFQRKGIGTMIVNHLVDYVKANSATGKFTTIGGVSAKGKEPFYEKMGFEIISNGMKKIIEMN